MIATGIPQKASWTFCRSFSHFTEVAYIEMYTHSHWKVLLRVCGKEPDANVETFAVSRLELSQHIRQNFSVKGKSGSNWNPTESKLDVLQKFLAFHSCEILDCDWCSSSLTASMWRWSSMPCESSVKKVRSD